VFASFLRDRVATMTVQEKQVVQLINRIKQDRERLAVEDIKEASTELDQAEDYARKCLEAVQKRNYRTARGLYDASDSLRELALQTLQTYKQILAAITSATPVR
jgi:ferritin